MYNQIADQSVIFKKWEKLINAENDIRDEQIKMSTAVVLENAQRKINERYKINNSRGLLTEASIYGGDGLGNAGITSVGTMGPHGNSIAATAGTATATLVVENQMAKEALESQMIQLKETFAEQGLKVDAVEVTVSEFGLKKENEQQEETAGDRRRNRRSRSEDNGHNEEDGVTDNVTAPERRSVDSTVDYTA